MNYTKLILSVMLAACLSLVTTACGGGGGGGGGDSGGGDSGGGDSGSFTEPNSGDLDGRTITIVSSNGQTLQFVYDHTGSNEVDITTGDLISASYSTLSAKQFDVSKNPGQADPLWSYEYGTVTWSSATEATMSGLYDEDAFDSSVAPVSVTATLTVSN